MLRSAFNMLTKLHSRAAQIKRPGAPDIFSPCRLTPTNHLIAASFKGGPDTTVIRGREFIITYDSLSGQFAQSISFIETPASGTFRLNYNSIPTTDLAFDILAEDLQVALRLLPGLADIVVTGSISTLFVVTFPGFSTTPPILTPSDSSTLLDADSDEVEITTAQTYTAWSSKLKRADKIIDPLFGLQTINELIELPDVGGAVMAYRIRCE